MGKSTSFAILLLLGAALASAWRCADSGFSGAGAKNKNNKSGSDKTTNGNSSDGDDDGKKGDDGEGTATGDDGTSGGTTGDTDSTIEDFLSSGDKIREDDDGVVLQKFQPEESQTPIDVAFVIDTSGSMKEEMDKVEQNITAFLSKLEADPKSKNAQIFVLAGEDEHKFTPPAALSTNQKFTFEGSNHEVDSHNALTIMREFLKGSLSVPKLKIRPDATKHLVFVTDDDANKNGDGKPDAIFEPEFRTFLGGYKEGEIVIHTISCPDGAKPCAAKGTAYQNLASDAKFKGVIEDLRSSDWAPIFDAIVDSIKSKAKLMFVLSKPAKSGSITVFLNGEKLDEGDYVYSKETNSVTLKKDAAGAKDQLVIKYQVE